MDHLVADSLLCVADRQAACRRALHLLMDGICETVSALGCDLDRRARGRGIAPAASHQRHRTSGIAQAALRNLNVWIEMNGLGGVEPEPMRQSSAA
jgi:hypothetical protein